MSMHRELSQADIKKVGVALSLLLTLGISGMWAWKKAQHNQEEAATFHQMNLEMGNKNEAVLTSRPEEESQKSDPHFQP